MSGALSAAAAAFLADAAEVAAFADLWQAAPPAIRSSLGLQLHPVAGATQLIAAGLPVPMFNRVIGLGNERAASEADLQALQRGFQAAGSRDWWLHWNPRARPANFPERLLAHGFTVPPRRSWAKMRWQGEALPAASTSLRVALATQGQVGAVMQAIVRAFGMPPPLTDWLGALHGRKNWRLYAACESDEVVGGACLYLDGDLAWLGMGSIVEGFRRRGGQRSLMALRVRDALEAGCRHVFTETGEPIADEANPSLINMQRCGFACVASRLNFAAPAAGGGT